MKKQRLPRGWTEKHIRELAADHDRQTEEEQAEEIEAALSAKDQTLMVVPTKLERKFRPLSPANAVHKVGWLDTRAAGVLATQPA